MGIDSNINLPISTAMLARIDVVRGEVPRTIWIRDVIERELSATRRREVRARQEAKAANNHKPAPAPEPPQHVVDAYERSPVW